MGYIFCFNLPRSFVTWFGIAGNFSFLRGAHAAAHHRHPEERNTQESLAATFGPDASMLEGKEGHAYGASVMERAKSRKEAFWHMTGYYRDGAGTQPWTKSLETIADLYILESTASESSSPGRRRSSMTNSLFLDQYKGALKAPAYIIWGEQDQACSKPICLDGLGDYLAKDSEIIILPRSAHWTPVEKESRTALAKVIASVARRDAKPVTSMTTEVQKVYAEATMMAKK
jgi:pimeloyl-ACP methyl ester carboxylesterase